MTCAASPRLQPSGPLAVLGAGAWGTVVASLLARNGHEVRLWSHREQLADAINSDHRNDQYVPGLALPPGVRATADLAAAVRGCVLAFMAVPSKAFRQVSESLVRVGAPPRS